METNEQAENNNTLTIHSSMNDTQYTITLKSSNIPSLGPKDVELIIQLPFTRVDRLVEIDDLMIKEAIVYDAMLLTFQQLEDNSLIGLIDNTMKILMTTRLTQLYSLNGNEDKISFRETYPMIFKCIFTAVYTQYPNMKIDIIEYMFGRFFERL